MPKDAFDYPAGLRPWKETPSAPLHRQGEEYTFSLLENSSDSYRFTAVAGAARIPEIFRAFAEALADEAFFILEYYPADGAPPVGEDPENPPNPTVFYSPYMPIEEIMEVIEPYLERLVHDGFVGFGIASNREGMELFYSEEKVLTCFTCNHIRVMDLFARHGLAHTKELVCPSDFGHDHLSLLCCPSPELPEALQSKSQEELDYLHFCAKLTETLDMYPIEESLSFFLSRKEQEAIDQVLSGHPEFPELAEEDFGNLLLDWNDFVAECDNGFEGDLWEYHQGLKIRDVIQFTVDRLPEALADKITEILAEADGRFRRNLVDRRKRIDAPQGPVNGEEHFWYLGVVRNAGVHLRRDLIRQGWYQP